MTESNQHCADVPHWLTATVILAAIAAAFTDVPSRMMSSPDSWSYLELSNSVFHDFYRQNTARAFEKDNDYSVAFPPLWPVLFAVVRQVADMGVLTGAFLAAISCAGLAIAMIALARRLEMPGWVGTAAFLTTMSVVAFNGEIQAGRSIPLSMALLIAAIAIMARPLRLWSAVLVALLMGFSCLNRFDALPVAVAMGCWVAVKSGRQAALWGAAIWSAVAYAAVFLIVLSPWVAYSQAHFGKPFVSDNTRQLYAAEGGHVIEFYDNPPPNDLTTNFRRWLHGLIIVKGRKVALAFIGGLRRSAVPLIVAALAVLWGGGGRHRLPARVRKFMLIAMAISPLIVAPAWLVGYGEARYFCPVYALVAVALSALMAIWAPAWSRGQASIYLIVLLGFPIYRWADDVYVATRDGKRPPAEEIPRRPTEEMNQITAAVHRDAAGRPHRLVLTHPTLAAAYGALTGEPTSLLPLLHHGTLRQFFSTWHITHVYDPEKKISPLPAFGYHLVPLELPCLYRVELDSLPPQPS